MASHLLEHDAAHLVEAFHVGPIARVRPDAFDSRDAEAGFGSRVRVRWDKGLGLHQVLDAVTRQVFHSNRGPCRHPAVGLSKPSRKCWRGDMAVKVQSECSASFDGWVCDQTGRVSAHGGKNQVHRRVGATCQEPAVLVELAVECRAKFGCGAAKHVPKHSVPFKASNQRSLLAPGGPYDAGVRGLRVPENVAGGGKQAPIQCKRGTANRNDFGQTGGPARLG